jgi:hypothetical protein
MELPGEPAGRFWLGHDEEGCPALVIVPLCGFADDHNCFDHGTC